MNVSIFKFSRLFLCVILFGLPQLALSDPNFITVNFVFESTKNNSPATLVLTVQSGLQGAPKVTPFKTSGNKHKFKIEIPKPPDDHPYLYFYGVLIGSNQQLPLGYVPVSIINISEYERWDLIDIPISVLPDRREALLSSYPLYPTFRQMLNQYPVESAFLCTKFLLKEKWITEPDEWQRVTSDYLSQLPRIFKRDSSKISLALQYLQEYGKLVNEKVFDEFYVEFLLKLKKLGIGGSMVGDQSLDDVILSLLNDVFATRLLHTYPWAANAVRDFRENNPRARCLECINLSDFLMNAINGALVTKQLSSDSMSVKGDVLSLLQATTLCAADYYQFQSESGNPQDTKEMAKYLWYNSDTKDYVLRFMALCKTVESFGWLPREPDGQLAVRIEEINKHYWCFLQAKKATLNTQ